MNGLAAYRTVVLAIGLIFAAHQPLGARTTSKDEQIPLSYKHHQDWMVAQATGSDGTAAVARLTASSGSIPKKGDTVGITLEIQNASAGQHVRLQNSNHGATFFTKTFGDSVQAAIAAIPGSTARKITDQQVEIELPAGSYKISISQTVSDQKITSTIDDASWASGLQLQVDWLLSTAPTNGMAIDRGHSAISKWITYQEAQQAPAATAQGAPADARWSILRSVPNIGPGGTVTFEIHETNYALASPAKLKLAVDGSSTASDADFVQGLQAAINTASSSDIGFDAPTGTLTFGPKAVFPFTFTMTAGPAASAGKDYILAISGSQVGTIDVARAGVRLGTLEMPSVTPMLGVNESSGEFGVGQYAFKYIYPGQDRINWVADQGFTIMRVPFVFQNLQPASGAPLTEASMTPLDAVVTGCAERQIVCVLDMHNYGTYYSDDSSSSGVPGTPNISNLRLADLWGKIAARYRDNPSVWFGLMNEPHQQTALEWVKTSNAIAAAIRATGAKNKILFSGTAWDGAWTWTSSGNAGQMLKAYDPGNNFAFEAHQYLDADGSGTSPNCVAGSGAARLTPFTDWLHKYRLYGIIGEVGWGANPSCDVEASALLDAWRAAPASTTNGGYIGLTYWANGPWWPDSYMYLAEPRPFPTGPEPAQLKTLKLYLPHASP